MPGQPNPNAPYWVQMRKYETELLGAALSAAGGEVQRAAALLGITRQMMARRCNELGLRVPKTRVQKVSGEAPSPATQAPATPEQDDFYPPDDGPDCMNGVHQPGCRHYIRLLGSKP